MLIHSEKTNAQNLLPLEWKLIFSNGNKTEEIYNINLLLSWERQGFSYLNEPGILSTKFHVPNSLDSSNLILELSLRLDIHQIHINGHLIGGNINNHFIWSAKPNYKIDKFSIPREVLNIGELNEITIKCSNFSYTGGLSQNFVKIYDERTKTNSNIEISFDSADHLFSSSDSALFKINTNSKSNAIVDVIIRNDYSDTIATKHFDIDTGNHQKTIYLRDQNLQPGFYEVIATLYNGGYVGDVKWFTVSPTTISDISSKPNDFSEFWNNSLRELSEIKPNFTLKKVDSLCTKNRDGFIVEMNSTDSVTIKAYYFVPRNKSNLPAILNLPGYGYGFEYLDEFLSVSDDVIEMALCVRGHGLSKDSFSPDPGTGFMGHKIYSKGESAYRKIYMDCMRAIDFLLTRPEIDKNKIGVFGGSQGGGLAIMTAGLAETKVSALAFFDPFPCDVRSSINIRTMIRKEIRGFLDIYNNKYSFEDALKTFDYLDTKFFADKVKANSFYLTALFDDDCPPRQGFSAYNKIRSPKSFKIFPNDSHIGESNYKKYAMAFFKDLFDF